MSDDVTDKRVAFCFMCWIVGALVVGIGLASNRWMIWATGALIFWWGTWWAED